MIKIDNPDPVTRTVRCTGTREVRLSLAELQEAASQADEILANAYREAHHAAAAQLDRADRERHGKLFGFAMARGCSRYGSATGDGAGAAVEYIRKPVGDWPETTQAWRALCAACPSTAIAAELADEALRLFPDCAHPSRRETA